jgi:hypothetical protein
MQRLRYRGPRTIVHAMNPKRRTCTLTALVLAGCVASCLGATEPLDVVTWEGELVPADDASVVVDGSVAIAILETETRVGIGIAISNADEGALLGWRIRAGTCNGTGSSVGDDATYPDIRIDDTGRGEAEAVVLRRIDTSGPYAGVVSAATATIACADLVRTD